MYLLDSTSAFYLRYTVLQPVDYGWLLSNSWQNTKSWNQSMLQRNSRQEFYKCSVSAVYSFLFYLPTLMLKLRSCQSLIPASTLYHPIKSPVDPPVRNVMMLTWKELATERNNPAFQSLSRHKPSPLRVHLFPPEKPLFLPSYPSHQ